MWIYCMDMRAFRLFMQKVQVKLSMCVFLCDVVMMGMYEEFKKKKGGHTVK